MENELPNRGGHPSRCADLRGESREASCGRRQILAHFRQRQHWFRSAVRLVAVAAKDGFPGSRRGPGRFLLKASGLFVVFLSLCEYLRNERKFHELQ